MRKSLLYALSGIGLLGAVVLGIFSLFYENADASHPQVIVSSAESGNQKTALPPPMISSHTRELEATESENTVSIPEIVSINSSEPEATVIDTDYEVLKMIETLNERFSQPLLSKAPGWVLIKAERYLPNSNVSLANGQLLPDTYIEEHWININQQNHILKTLDRSIAKNGNLLRQNYQEANRETTDMVSDQESNPITLDYGTLGRILTGLDFGSEIRGWIETKDNAERYIVTITNYFDAPVQYAGQSKKSNSSQNRLTFDIKSGRFLSAEIIHQFSDDTPVVIESLTVLDIQIMPLEMIPEEVKQTLLRS